MPSDVAEYERAEFEAMTEAEPIALPFAESKTVPPREPTRALIALSALTRPYPMSMFGHGNSTQSAVWKRTFRTDCGVKEGLLLSIRATVPETMGVAIEVPMSVAYPPPSQVEKMLTPGATSPWSRK